MKSKQFQVKTIAFISMLGALSAVLMAINVPLPFAPTFLKFDISELPALFAGFFLGPASGGGVIAVKLLLKVLLQGTETAFVGELMNLFGSCAFVLPAALIYRRWPYQAGSSCCFEYLYCTGQCCIHFLKCLCGLSYVFLSIWDANGDYY